MSAEIDKIREIFLEAIENHSPDQWDDFLERACEGNVPLRTHVQQLLDGHVHGASLIDGRSIATIEEPPESKCVGQRIGPYKLREKIGEGGFGVVYVAEQKKPVSRKVALKVIKPGMDSKDIIARFEAERQALAIMDHPNVAKVLDAGATESSRPYFVMELVHGVAITEYCDLKKLTNRQRLELFIDVCHAVQHAHQKGIIHRDIKPSNVMITMADHRAVVKVIDFGVAKALHRDLTDKSIYTGYGQMVGTPMYMSPEQAELSSLDVDTRSDIYSLGVLLYELLTGTTLFDNETIKNAGFDEMRRMIREVEPRRPSEQVTTLQAELISTICDCRKIDQRSLSKALRGDLDWIVMKTLEKDRTRRYETATMLAEDVQRFLNEEPVLACPPSTTYRLRKFAARNKVGLAFASLTLMFLVAGIVGLTISNYLLKQRGSDTLEALRTADKNLQQAIEAKQNAQRNFAQLQKSNELITSIFEDLNINDVKKGAEPLESVLAQRLSEAAEVLEATISDNDVIKADMQYKLGEALFALGYADKAKPLFIASLETRRNELGQANIDTIDTRISIAKCLNREGKFQEGLEILEQCWEQLSSNRWPDSELHSVCLSWIWASQAGIGLDLQALETAKKLYDFNKKNLNATNPKAISSQILLAESLMKTGQSGEAIKFADLAWNQSRQILGDTNPRTLGALSALASAYEVDGQIGSALELRQKHLSLVQEKLGQIHPQTLQSNFRLATAYSKRGEASRAIELFKAVLDSTIDRYGENHPNTFQTLGALGRAYYRSGDTDKGVQQIKKVLELQEKYLRAKHPDTLSTKTNLAMMALNAGQFDEAIQSFELLVAESKQSLGPTHQDTISRLASLGLAQQRSQQYEVALENLKASYDLACDHLSQNNRDRITVGMYYAEALKASGQLDRAIEIVAPMYDSQRAIRGEHHALTLRLENTLALLYWSNDQLDLSIPLFKRSLAKYVAKYGEDHISSRIVQFNLGVNYKDAESFDKAISNLEPAYSTFRNKPSMLHMGIPLLDAYVCSGLNREATILSRHILASLDKSFDKDDLQRAKILEGLARTYFLENESFQQAEELLRECLAIRKTKMPDDWRFFNAKSLLGEALLGQERFVEAEKELMAGFQGLSAKKQKIPRRLHSRIEKSIERLIRLHEIQHDRDSNNGHDERANEWRDVLEKFTKERQNRDDK